MSSLLKLRCSKMSLYLFFTFFKGAVIRNWDCCGGFICVDLHNSPSFLIFAPWRNYFKAGMRNYVICLFLDVSSNIKVGAGMITVI